MIGASGDSARPALVRWPQRILKSPIELIRITLEATVTRRGLVLLFVAVAMVIAVSAWLRPPLSPDLRAQHIPLAIPGRPIAEADQLLAVPRTARIDSIGSLLLGFLAVGGFVAFVWPRRLALIAAILLCLSIVSNAMLSLNYPSLVDRMEAEREQRQQIALLLVSLHPDSLANGGEPRVSPRFETSPLWRGYDYLLYGPWLLAWSAAAVLFASRGSIGRRLAWISLTIACGFIAATAMCLPRLRAEFYCAQATELNARREFVQARELLDRATLCCPDIDSAWRVRQLRGKLDYRLNAPSTDQDLWRIDQWMRNGEGAQAIAMVERLAGAKPNDIVVTRFAAELFTRVGLEYWAQGRSVAAGRMWQQAIRFDEQRWDSRFMFGTVQSRIDRNRPELVDAELSPIIGRMADRLIRADILASLGDAYFDAGDIDTARRHYAESLRAFELPKEINYRARKGLVGM